MNSAAAVVPLPLFISSLSSKTSSYLTRWRVQIQIALHRKKRDSRHDRRKEGGGDEWGRRGGGGGQ